MGKSPDAWIAEADGITSKAEGFHFPPKYRMPLQQVVTAAWQSFRFLNRARKHRQGDAALACAEHFAFARVVVCAGGPVMYPLVVSLGLYYDLAKWALDKVGLRQLLDANTDGHGFVTSSSPEQVKAALDGAGAGLRLHFSALE